MGLSCLDLGLQVQGRWLLQGVTGQVVAGQLTAVVGPNGAGKSTLLHLCSGGLVPTAGQVSLDGRALPRWPVHELARRRAVLAQDTPLAFHARVDEVVALGRYPHRRQPSYREPHIVPEALAQAGVAHLAGQLLHTLSGGERARVHFARVLTQVWEAVDGGSRWLLLDEPTAALDLRHQTELLQRARDWACHQGVGVVAVLHDLNLALRFADQVWVMHEGRCVAQGDPTQVLTPACLAQVWGVQAWLAPTPTGQPRLQWV